MYRELFAELQESPCATADLSPFTSSLNLNHAIQQVRGAELVPRIACLQAEFVLLSGLPAGNLCEQALGNMCRALWCCCVQDSQEFFKLLLSMLENRLSRSSNAVRS